MPGRDGCGQGALTSPGRHALNRDCPRGAFFKSRMFSWSALLRTTTPPRHVRTSLSLSSTRSSRPLLRRPHARSPTTRSSLVNSASQPTESPVPRTDRQQAPSTSTLISVVRRSPVQSDPKIKKQTTCSTAPAFLLRQASYPTEQS